MLAFREIFYVRTFIFTVYYFRIYFVPPAYAVGVMFSLCLCVCLSVCLCVCLYVCLSVQAITFEPADIETSFLV